MRRTFLFVLLSGFILQPNASTQPLSAADSVKAEFLHAWHGYEQMAWGHDALQPLSGRPHDWYPHSLLMTPVDAFDGMVMMGLTGEASKAKKIILDSLTFDLPIEVQSFEITIRLLGGLLSAYQLDGDPRFLERAEDLGRRLLPVFKSSTGMPYRFVNLRTGAVRDSINNPAEIGTSLLEFGTLSRLTGNPVYYAASKRALVALFRHRSPIGLVGTWINVETGEWTDTVSHIGGAIDSYYEYCLKAWKLFGDPDCRHMWEDNLAAVNRYVADSAGGRLWYGQVGMNSGKRTGTRFGSLEAFFPGALCLAGDTDRAVRLESSCYAMWNLNGIEPEEIDYTTMTVTDGRYYLRPEIIESAWYLRRATGNPIYRAMGETFLHGLTAFCRTDNAYAYLQDVRTKEKGDGMESFFLAETLKYLYLLLSPRDAFPPDGVVFNTEAHPLRRTWKE